ncbi:hypothetical protein QBC34DRAFT_424778 [Podospora aff. communis PSN243]|uniref:Uncharacterized protein n=1 Tax=Podospora aff. communis PSN243 TaxID=3040156 RepID=A0AAV9GRK3_9PEZI|nr:hypothetical protein QBC34DRAFT_424778 [Podospora aff. communis PSN243]
MNWYPSHRYKQPIISFGMLVANKLLAAEAAQVVYSKNKFRIHGDLESFLEQIWNRNKGCIRRLCLPFPSMDIHPYMMRFELEWIMEVEQVKNWEWRERVHALDHDDAWPRLKPGKKLKFLNSPHRVGEAGGGTSEGSVLGNSSIDCLMKIGPYVEALLEGYSEMILRGKEVDGRVTFRTGRPRLEARPLSWKVFWETGSPVGILPLKDRFIP